MGSDGANITEAGTQPEDAHKPIEPEDQTEQREELIFYKPLPEILAWNLAWNLTRTGGDEERRVETELFTKTADPPVQMTNRPCSCD